MEKLGSRIKRLRKEKGVKQSFLHDNQSAVSQIERGFNENPSPELLRKVAENLEITFEELVKGTSWSAPKDSNSEGKYGYSELDFELTLSEAGKISIQHKRYPKFDSNGLENRFCPNTATPLIFSCKSCQKPIQSNEQVFCMGCGKKIFRKQIYETMDECLINLKVDNLFLDRKRIIHNSHPTQWAIEIDMLYTTNEVEKDVTPKKYSEVKADLPMLREVIDTLHYSKIVRDRYGSSYSIDSIKAVYDEHGQNKGRLRNLFRQKAITEDQNFEIPDNLDELAFIQGLQSKDDQYYNFHLSLEYRKKFFELLAFELSKLTLEDNTVIVYNDELPL